jgi:hypothetical protein
MTLFSLFMSFNDIGIENWGKNLDRMEGPCARCQPVERRGKAESGKGYQDQKAEGGAKGFFRWVIIAMIIIALLMLLDAVYFKIGQ